jgi:hypothetical protein
MDDIARSHPWLRTDLGPNALEFEAINMQLSYRGMRTQERLGLPRRLWLGSDANHAGQHRGLLMPGHPVTRWLVPRALRLPSLKFSRLGSRRASEHQATIHQLERYRSWISRWATGAQLLRYQVGSCCDISTERTWNA